MKMTRRILSCSTGNSLVEILIALALTGIITTAVLGLYYRQHTNYMIQDDVTNIQQNARASIDEITRQVRMAGYQIPSGVPALVAANTNPDTITINYSPNDCETYLENGMVTGASELECGDDVSCFSDGQWAYIFHPDSGGGEWFEITTVDVGGKRLAHASMDLSEAYDEDAIVVALTQVKFFVDKTGDSLHPALMMQMPGRSPQVYAENVADLQVRYRLENGNIVDNPVLIEDITEVLINLTAQSDQFDFDLESPTKRSRSYASSASLRNVGL